MVRRTSIYDVSEDQTQYGNSKRRKLLAKRYGVTFHRMLAFGLAVGIPSHADLTLRLLAYSELYNSVKKRIKRFEMQFSCFVATDPAYTHYQDGIPSHFATNHRHSGDASYTSPHYVTCVSTTSLTLQQFFYSWATKWSTDCEVKAMTYRARMKDPQQSLRGNSFAILYFSQLGTEYSDSTKTLLIQSDTSINSGVKRACPHYSTFCKCIPCDSTQTGSLFHFTTDGYNFL